MAIELQNAHLFDYKNSPLSAEKVSQRKHSFPEIPCARHNHNHQRTLAETKMGVFDSIKLFVHLITTEDHYASFELPYRNLTLQNASLSRLQELGRLATANLLSASVDEANPNASHNNSSTNLAGARGQGYRPGLKLLLAANGSFTANNNGLDVQLQSLNTSGQPPLPLIDLLWRRIESWLEEEYPELEDNLNDGATTADLNEFENDLGIGALPVEFRQFYKVHDGQMRGGEPTGLLLGLTLLDLESIGEEYRIWAKVAQRLEKQQFALQHQQHQIPGSSTTSSPGNSGLSNSFLANQKLLPPQAVQCVYVHRGWIPFARDGEGNLAAIDFAPGPTGTWGQIILFGRHYDTKVVVASLFHEFIFGYIQDIDLGNYSIDNSEYNTDYGYLELLRNDDYMIGAEEEGQGELMWYDRSGKEFLKGLGKLTYLDVVRMRALRRLGIQNVESFNTQYQPPRRVATQPSSGAASGTAAGSGSTKKSPEELTKTGQTSSPQTPLINIEGSVKETLIDEDSLKKEQKKTMKESQKKPEDKIEVKKEQEKVDEKDEKEDKNEETKSEIVPEVKNEADDVPEEKDVAEEASESISKTADELKEVAL